MRCGEGAPFTCWHPRKQRIGPNQGPVLSELFLPVSSRSRRLHSLQNSTQTWELNTQNINLKPGIGDQAVECVPTMREALDEISQNATKQAQWLAAVTLDIRR